VAQPLHPSISRVAGVARALGELSGDVVFIGGAIAPLLQSNPVMPQVRPTDDVDALVASTSYGSHGAMEDKMRALGFKTESSDLKHVHRWRTPDGTPFDLVPAGEHLGGTGGVWDRAALDTAVKTQLEPGLVIRHASATGFLALKWAAFWDRGAGDPFRSEDLEDILALLVSRDSIVLEFHAAPRDVQEHIRKGLNWLKRNNDYADLVAAFLGSAAAFSHAAALLRERIAEMLS